MIPVRGQLHSRDINEWKQKLLGKTIVKDSQETTLDAERIVRESELPSSRRILPPNSVMTMDYRPERLNIHVDDAGTVRSVNFG